MSENSWHLEAVGDAMSMGDRTGCSDWPLLYESRRFRARRHRVCPGGDGRGRGQTQLSLRWNFAFLQHLEPSRELCKAVSLCYLSR